MAGDGNQMNVKKMILFALDFEVLTGGMTGSFRTYVACKDAKTALEMAEKTEVEDKPGSTLKFLGLLSVAPVVVQMPDVAEAKGEKAPLNPNHMLRLVGHVGGYQEQMDVCICGKPWPCAGESIPPPNEDPSALDLDLNRHYPPGWVR